ncbi:putative hydrolase [Cutaneotrichosporon oleaginosum]|uniref:Putative hydrolase n=1 Tax=Cutaneotrichosporon oleaginosum TaxID=879819 RepID=A0A0J0XNE4_9TREE|nr:putative hydrolase [Cutaneotrichosporon oleaginosum]KLT42640.1 putative hydrolase [Cutaneotrichosporon oleaginosum]TXT05243.1 hypothetical protein COLE_06563 [Cutaneotrichosporon oleaginosum]
MQTLRGTLVDTPQLGALRIRRDHVICVDACGVISSIAPASATTPALLASATPLPRHTFLLPPFADLHLHAPQYLNAGSGLDLPLMEWLDAYTYPAEERVDADPALAAKLYTRLAQRLLEAGTGAALFFGTIGVEANLILAKACQDAGVRGYIGKLSMDQSPRSTYGEASPAESLANLHAFLDSMATLTSPLAPHERLVQPVLTPRFVPVCSDALLSSLGALAAERNLMIQSHMCESRDQMAWVHATRGRKDEHVFDTACLLTPRTVQAHVTSLTPNLVGLIKERGVTVAHCPLSNAYFSDAAFPLREALDAGVKIGLGSDIAGGYALPVQAAMRNAVLVARLREGAKREATFTAAAGAEPAVKDGEGIAEPDECSLRVDWTESLYLATAGGRAALGLPGTFRVSAPFDAQQITLAGDDGPLGLIDFFDLPCEDADDTWWRDAIERWWCVGDDRNRTGMWVQGRRVR